MDFVQAVKTGCKKWIVFSGCASRSEYWWFFLFNFLFVILAEVVIGATQAKLLLILFAIAMLYLLVASIAIGVRRLHDTNRSGWWMFIGLIPIIGGIILLIFFILPSSTGKNQFT